MANLVIQNDNDQNLYFATYKSYVAILTQSGTDHPVATVFNSQDSNFLGNIAWTRQSMGYYLGTLVGEMPDDKTLVQCQVLSNTAAITAALPQASGPDAVGLYTGDNPYGMANGEFVDIGGSGVLIKIDVYQ